LPNGQGETILIVDDEDNIRAVAKRILEKHGYRVLTACEGTEAVAVYAQHYTDIKLVMTDIIMPYMDGMATIRALKKMNARLKLVAASGLGSDPKLTDPTELGVHAFLRKPFTAESLLKTLQRVLQDEVV
jgi:two-component system, cell cycle sensor histidine kinase and response regulator CckA